MRWTWMAVLALVAGCDGIDLEQLVRQHAALTRVVPLPPGADCAHGGRALLAGLDLDDDGLLDDSEVTSTEALCATALTRKRPEPEGGNCTHGGQAVQTGVDVDASGQLDDAEVTATEYLCDTLVPDVLVRAQAVPPGERCPRGGQVSRAGHDTNGNGELEDGEVTREVYGCSEPERVLARVRALTPPPHLCPGGTTVVEAGPDVDLDNELDDAERRAMVDFCAGPLPVLVRLIPEPAGAHCLAGGTRVRGGLDADADGTLEDTEPFTDTFVCQPLHTHHGPYVVQSAVDLAALQGISHIRGHLYLTGSSLTEAVLPGLAVVEGMVRVQDNAALTRLELPGLRFVGQDLSVSSNASLETLVLGGAGRERLWVESNLLVDSNPRLQGVSGLALVAPRQGLYLRDNDALQHAPWQEGFIAVHTLADVLVVSGNDALGTLPFSSLQQVGGFLRIDGNPALQSLEGMWGLRTVGMDAYITDNDGLRSLAGLELLDTVYGGLQVSGNDGLLTTEGLPALTRVGSLLISMNGSLEAAGGMPQLRSVGYTLEVSGNPKLLTVRNLGALRSVSSVELNDNPLLAGLPGLAGVQQLSGLAVRRNGALESLEDLEGLRELGALWVLENASLTRLSLGALQQVSEEFTVTHNPRLPTCLATALAADVFTGAEGQLRISDNDDAATCGN